MAFVEDGNKYGSDQLLSGTDHKIMELEVPAGKKVVRGDIVNSACDLSDGTDLFGVVLEDADGITEKTKTTVAVFGEVIFENLNIKIGTNKSDFTLRARNKGIIVKQLGGKE